MMKPGKIITIVVCVMFLFILSGAKKTKKTVKLKTGAEISALKEKVSTLEAVKVSLTAKVETLEKEKKKLKESSKMAVISACIAGGIALVLAVALLFGRPKGPQGIEGGAGHTQAGTAGRERHYEDLEYHVLNDWQNIWFHPENIDSKLYDDLKNHFPELHSDIERWKNEMNERQELALDAGKELSFKFPDVEALPNIFMLAYEEPNTFIGDYELKSGPSVCARLKEGSPASKEILASYAAECVLLFEKKPYSGIKDLNAGLIRLKSGIDLAIRKIKFTKELPGSCGYVS